MPFCDVLLIWYSFFVAFKCAEILIEYPKILLLGINGLPGDESPCVGIEDHGDDLDVR